MGIAERDFWSMALKVWLAALEAWASQYPDSEANPEPLSREDYDALWAGLSEAERAALGLTSTAEH